MTEIKRGPSFKPWGVRAIRNTKPHLWPPEPKDFEKAAKWQTRRLVKPQPMSQFTLTEVSGRGVGIEERTQEGMSGITSYATYQPGTYYICEPVHRKETYGDDYDVMAYVADGEYAFDKDGELVKWQKENGEPYKVDKLHGIYMPKRVARTRVEIQVEVERLRNISEESCIAEGVCAGCMGGFLKFWPQYAPEAQYATGQRAFQHIWEDINGPESWERNPLVWVYNMMRLPDVGCKTGYEVYEMPEGLGGGWGARAGCEISDGFESREAAEEWGERKARELDQEREEL